MSLVLPSMVGLCMRNEDIAVQAEEEIHRDGFSCHLTTENLFAKKPSTCAGIMNQKSFSLVGNFVYPGHV